MVRAHVFYSGTVQGVGFRYTVQRFAAQLNITGWVKNLPDGRVEILAEGPKDRIEELLKKVESRFEGYIRGQDKDYQPAGGDFRRFEIAF